MSNTKLSKDFLDMVDDSNGKLKSFLTTGVFDSELKVIQAFGPKGPAVTIIEVPHQRWEFWVGANLRGQLPYRLANWETVTKILKSGESHSSMLKSFLAPLRTEQVRIPHPPMMGTKTPFWKRVNHWFRSSMGVVA